MVVTYKPTESGWWLSHPSEKYEVVNWDDYSQHMEKEKMFQITNQLQIAPMSPNSDAAEVAADTASKQRLVLAMAPAQTSTPSFIEATARSG